MTSPYPVITTVAVIVPVHDEEALLGACLASLRRAVRDARSRVASLRVTVVLDACTDRSAAIAARHHVRSLSIDARQVGTARRIGVQAALEDKHPAGLHRVWTAHTDADSVVPRNWITHQLDLAETGAEVVIGTVRPDFADLSAAQVHAWTHTHTPGLANGHVHGANLGVRADWLARAGGFDEIAEHEDVLLVERLRAGGAICVASDGAAVTTSGRQTGRTPGGYARYLREDLIPSDAQLSPEVA